MNGLRRNMRGDRRVGLALGALGCALAGCASPEPVSLVVSDGAGLGVRGAHVRAIALDDGPVALPLNADTLREMQVAGKTDEQGVSGADGRLSLRLEPGERHMIEVSVPPWSAGPEEPSRWLYWPNGDLTPINVPARQETPVRLRVAR